MDKQENTTTVHDACEMANAVLQRTNDGTDLYPPHLGMVKWLVNGDLNDQGIDAFFHDIYDPVMAGTYAPPAYHHVQGLTLDQEGYVRWKGHIVEHFSWEYAYNDRSRSYAEMIGRAAIALESSGEPVDSGTVWVWLDEHEPTWHAQLDALRD